MKLSFIRKKRETKFFMLKETRNSYFRVTLKNQALHNSALLFFTTVHHFSSQQCITFLQVTQKILTKDIFH